ncbi:MAG: HupE/UreJ family protein, partial [Pedobacter sp.]|nr:HupE/UreJ family protein [Chitinophagaceae bacterium]
NKESLQLNYFFALFFGFIHGLGFANSIRFMLASNQKIGTGLLGFNLGLEAGQIVCVTIILLSAYLVINIAGLKRTWWIYTLSTVTILWAVKFAVERIP